MYDNFERLLIQNNLKPADVARGTGLTTSFFSEWKKGKTTPKVDKLKKIADFFNVPIEYFLTGENSLSNRDERDIEKRLAETLNQIESEDGLMFNGEILDDDTKRLLEISLRSTLESAKIAAKKFTPNKFKE